MIPGNVLATLNPLPDQLIRERMVKSKRSPSFRKGRLSHRARQWALYISRIGIIAKEPSGIRSYGNKPMKERKK